MLIELSEKNQDSCQEFFWGVLGSRKRSGLSCHEICIAQELLICSICTIYVQGRCLKKDWYTWVLFLGK